MLIVGKPVEEVPTPALLPDLESSTGPRNPNGAYPDIPGICNPEGNIHGLMPHPQHTYYGYLIQEWAKERQPAPLRRRPTIL